MASSPVHLSLSQLSLFFPPDVLRAVKEGADIQITVSRMESGRIYMYVAIHSISMHRVHTEDPFSQKMLLWMCLESVLAQLGCIQETPTAGATLFVPEKIAFNSNEGSSFVQGKLYGDSSRSSASSSEGPDLSNEELLRILSTREGWDSIHKVHFTGRQNLIFLVPMREVIRFKDEILVHRKKLLAFAMATHPKLLRESERGKANASHVGEDVARMIARFFLQDVNDAPRDMLAWTEQIL